MVGFKKKQNKKNGHTGKNLTKKKMVSQENAIEEVQTIVCGAEV